MTKRAVFITNVPHEGPGMLGPVIAELGYEVSLVEAYRGERWPGDLNDQDLLVVMGGPMGVADVGSPEFPWLGPVARLLQKRLHNNAPNLGVCLGCQLLAHAAGAKVAPMHNFDGERVREVGWGPIKLFSGADDCVRGLPERFDVLHWHGDACELPAGAKLLASTEVCQVQMFRLGRSIGMQFHPEIDGPTSCVWAEEDAEFVRAAHGAEGVRKVQSTALAAAERAQEVRARMVRGIVRAVAG